MRKNALLFGGILLVIVAFAGLYFGYDVKAMAAGEGPNERWMWISFALQLAAGICFILQHFLSRRNSKKEGRSN